MHMIFGTKENAPYTDREGAYVILLREGTVGLIQTPKGYFLPGGGMDAGESPEACIARECGEEMGYDVEIFERIGSAESYTTHPVIGRFHPIQIYYTGRLTEPVGAPTEQDHRLVWVPQSDAPALMFSEMQAWAIRLAIEGK